MLNDTDCIAEGGITVASVSPAWPGHVLSRGSQSSEVARVQEYLNALRAKYPTLTSVTVDGKYGSGTETTVKQYQAIAGLQIDGKVGRNTWDALIGAYNAAFGGSADTWPGITLRPGDSSQDIRHMQQRLNEVARLYTGINTQTVDGKYGGNMSAAVRRFQHQFGLSSDALLGKSTWNKIVEVYGKMASGRPAPVVTPYPGYVMSTGTTGDFVRFAQSYLNAISGRPLLTVDGQYGQDTARRVGAFQASKGLKVVGKLGRDTWAALIPAFNATL